MVYLSLIMLFPAHERDRAKSDDIFTFNENFWIIGLGGSKVKKMKEHVRRWSRPPAVPQTSISTDFHMVQSTLRVAPLTGNLRFRA